NAQTVLGDFSDLFNDYWLVGMRKKIGIYGQSPEDETLIAEFRRIRRDGRADFTLAFRYLADCVDPVSSETRFRELFASCDSLLEKWLEKWRERVVLEKDDAETIAEKMRSTNPLYIARNQNVENVLRAAAEGNYQPFEELLAVLQHPY